jgi:hypothetical protein
MRPWLEDLLAVLVAAIISTTGCLAAIMLAVWAGWLQ